MLDTSSHDQILSWREHGTNMRARWLTADGHRPPCRVIVVGDDLSADKACRMAAEGTGLLWRGDYHNARHLLAAMRRRIDRSSRRRELAPAEEFRRQRQDRARQSRLLGAVLVQLGPGFVLDLRRAPSIDRACQEVYGDLASEAVVSLQELAGVLGAHEWRRTGIEIPALGARIHPHYGVFAPTRTDYLDLVAEAPLPPARTAFDIGTGTGVLAAILLSRGIPRVIATDIEDRAVACARDNLDRLGYAERATVIRHDLFPAGRADLVVCNPPWVPGTPTSALDAGVFDRGNAMLAGFLRQLPDHLTSHGEGWLLLSDLPEQLGLRDPDLLRRSATAAGLVIRGRRAATSATRTTTRRPDPLAAIRSRETISLWTFGCPSQGRT
ncbi:methyltransferase [Pseudonocardia sp. CA-142604]|uniref:methyltransferase n=1 Tax=Pseudonocardia sp. CA-142604 TaxID=3240024 RepID=UPI003D8EAFF9